jgi:hypothetical protein
VSLSLELQQIPFARSNRPGFGLDFVRDDVQSYRIDLRLTGSTFGLYQA